MVVGVILGVGGGICARAGASESEGLLVWPLETGRTWTYHCRDSGGTEWAETREVLGTAERGGNTFFTLRVTDYDPDDPQEVTVLVRSTEYAILEWSEDKERLIMVAGPVGAGILNEDALRTLVSRDTISVPYGGPYEAYTYELQEVGEEEPFMTASFVKGLGFIKFVEYAGGGSSIVKELLSISPDRVCGDYGCPYPEGDINRDCIVDFLDLAILADHWLESNDCGGGSGHVNKISSHVREISIIEGIDYGHPDEPGEEKNEFILEVYANDTLESVDLLLPDWTFCTIPDILRDCAGSICTEHYEEGGRDVWRYEQSSIWSLKNYDGLFRITAHYKNGGQDTTSVWFGKPGLPEAIPKVTQKPVVTYPPHDVNVPSPVSITWLPCKDEAATSIDIMLQHEGEGGWYEEESFPTSATSWPNRGLAVNPYEIELDFRHFYTVADNGDGVPFTVGKYTQSDYEFGVE